MNTRWVAAMLAALMAALVAPGAQALPAADCSTPQGLADMQASVKANLDAVRQGQKAKEAEIDREIQRRTTADGWTRDHQTKVMMGILASPRFSAFEKEKQPMTAEIMSIALAPGGDPTVTCANGLRLKAIVGQVQAINAREYGFMLDEVKAAK